MIKQFIYFILINIFIICCVIADDTSILMLKNRLKKIDSLYVHFEQKINNVDGNIVEECQGECWIKRPNLFYWHVTYPEESFLISDGMTLWFYVPIIKQVTAYCVQYLFDNVLWMLFFNEKISWNNYDVHHKGDYFYLKSIYDCVNTQEYMIKITKQGIPEQCSVIGSCGEYLDYYLSQQNNNKIDVSQFIFKIPEDVQLDDQRK